MNRSKSYSAKFSAKSVAEALFHNTSDRNLVSKDLELFLKSQESKIYKTQNSISIEVCYFVVKKKNLHKKTYNHML